jgi:hypothetical protein
MAVLPSKLVAHAERCQSTAGRFEQSDGDALFVPRFPLVGGLSYSLLIDGAEVAAVTAPVSASTPTTRVVSIHPSAVEVPVNLLRVYISFSAPMAEGFAARAVRARVVETGELLDDLFLPMDTERWDESRQQLTLLLDPDELERLHVPQGEPIGISVDRSMRDAAGRPLRGGGGRVYKVGPANRALIDPYSWDVAVPAAGSVDELVVSFDRALDRAFMRHCFEVRDDATTVTGTGVVDGGERVWRFEPAAPWRAGSYALSVDPLLEDVAGNSIACDTSRVDVRFSIPNVEDRV